QLWNTKLDLGYGLDKRDDRDGAFPGDATTKRYSFSWQNDLHWADNQLLITGVDYSNEEIKGSTEFKEDQRYNAGVFAQNTSTFSGSDLQLGLRRDKNEAYGYNNTGNASWGFDLPASMRLIASYGTAFRAPTFYDLYGPFGANPDLKAETSENSELELRGSHAGVRWSVNIFQNNMDDMLLYTAGKMQNVDKARIRGVELTAATELSGWNIHSNLSLLDPENRSGSNKGKVLQRRAKELFVLDAQRRYGRLSVGGTFRAQGTSYNDTANKEKVAGFGTLDLRFGYEMTSELKTELKIVNLMDKEYATTDGYRDTPRSGFVTLIWTPASL
ncbi:MAG: TonB-dependent receptor domain-containing protein, partial [Endozoicomonas sp.]